MGQWLDARGYTGTIRTTARTFAIALRDYGMIQTMTTGGPWTIPVSGGRNAQTAAGWRSNVSLPGRGQPAYVGGG